MSRRAVEERRHRVLELRLAGLSASAIAEELRREEAFKHTTQDTVRNDIKALKKRAKLEEIDSEPIVKDIFQKCRDSISVVSRRAQRRFMEINAQIARVQGQIADVVEQLQAPEQSVNSRGELIIQCDRLVSLGSKLRSEARAETRAIISINQTLIHMPKTLGLVLETEEVAEGVDVAEAIAKAMEDETDPDRIKKTIEVLEFLGDILED